MRILIVDGSSQKRRNLVDVLDELADVVIQGAVGDVRSALRAVVEVRPDVVVTNALLPDGEGTHLISRIRELDATPSIVVVSAAESDEQRERYLAAGAHHYVANDAELRTAVASLARVRHASGSVPPIYTLELLGRMTSAVVHDLNNYVGVLGAMLTLLRRHPADERLWQQAQQALDAIERLDATLLEYARGGAPAREPIDLGDVVRATIKLAGRLIPPAVTVRLDIADKLAPLHAVRTDLEQLVLNLVINACDAMPGGGELHVAVRLVPYAVLLDIEDTGTGSVPSPTLGRAQSSKPHGVGLGLGIVQAVVERYGGAIRIVKRSTGGTLVAVMLPL